MKRNESKATLAGCIFETWYRYFSSRNIWYWLIFVLTLRYNMNQHYFCQGPLKFGVLEQEILYLNNIYCLQPYSSGTNTTHRLLVRFKSFWTVQMPKSCGIFKYEFWCRFSEHSECSCAARRRGKLKIAVNLWDSICKFKYHADFIYPVLTSLHKTEKLGVILSSSLITWGPQI